MYSILVFTVTLHSVILFRKVSAGLLNVTTEGNPAYGLSGPHEHHGETKDEYDYI